MVSLRVSFLPWCNLHLKTDWLSGRVTVQCLRLSSCVDHFTVKACFEKYCFAVGEPLGKNEASWLWNLRWLMIPVWATYWQSHHPGFNSELRYIFTNAEQSDFPVKHFGESFHVCVFFIYIYMCWSLCLCLMFWDHWCCMVYVSVNKFSSYKASINDWGHVSQKCSTKATVEAEDRRSSQEIAGWDPDFLIFIFTVVVWQAFLCRLHVLWGCCCMSTCFLFEQYA